MKEKITLIGVLLAVLLVLPIIAIGISLAIMFILLLIIFDIIDLIKKVR